MSFDQPNDELASVLSLDCARVADALAEGTPGPELEAHLDSCASCATLAVEMRGVENLIAEATAPVTPPHDFASRVLDRAHTLTLDLEHDLPEALSSSASSRAAWPTLAAVASAAAIALAFWAGGMNAQLDVPHDQATVSSQVEVSPASVSTASPSPTRAATGEVTLRPASALPGAHVAAPAVVTLEPLDIPEPELDIPGEIQAALLQVIEDQEDCPERSGGSVRITATVEPTGAIVDRQIVSSGEASRAHRCVTEALDGLRLPPLAQRARVTLDLRW